MKNIALPTLFLMLALAPVDGFMLTSPVKQQRQQRQPQPKQQQHVHSGRSLTSRYKGDCWKKRPVASLVTKVKPTDPGYPGAGLREFVPFETVLKDGFIKADCVKDELFLHGDKFGDSRHSYTLGDVANVSIVHYAAKVPKRDRQKMTHEVCFQFCRTVPNMLVFGILNGRECYCAPYHKRLASDDSQCDATCEGDSTQLCGSKTKSSIFVMHLCGDTGAQLAESRKLSQFVLGDLDNRIQLATSLSNILEQEGGRQQDIFSKAGNPGVSDLMQDAKNLGKDLVHVVDSSKKVMARLKALAAESEKQDLGNLKEIVAAEKLLDKMATAVEAGKKARTSLGKLIVLARPGGEKLGAAGTYYPMMYFVDKQLSSSMQTCSGDIVKRPIVGETMDGCASACDAELGENACIGFNYFGTGKTSLCFLLSSFKKAVVYTGCKKKSSFLQSVTTKKRGGSSESKVKPWECGKVGRPFQVVNRKSSTEVLALNIKTGEYERVFELNPDLYKNFGIKDVNSCAINPVDSIIYCTMKLKSFRKCVLARMDSESVSFVARVKCGFVSGTFDAHGNLYYNNNKQLWTARKVQNLAGVAKPFGIGDLRKDTGFATGLGYDIAAMEADLDGKGTATYVVGLKDTTLTMVRVSSDPYKTFELKATGETASGGFGAAWNFNNELYFANNGGKGVYQLDLGSIDLKAGTAKLVRAGSAMETSSNDGMGCPKGVSPFPPVLPPKPEPVEWMHDEMQQIKVAEEPELKIKKVEPPKVGEVHCMGKFSKFAGTTVKPDPSGKCKHCFKKLIRLDRCY